MAYSAKDALSTLCAYLNIDQDKISYIDGTDQRGFMYHTKSGENSVIFVYPISQKVNGTKSFFDTRDSAAYEREAAWDYSIQHNIKYFCLAVQEQVKEYNGFIFSLECNEQRITNLVSMVNGQRSRKTQVVIPRDYTPSKDFERIKTKNNFYIAVIRKDAIKEYLDQYDNRPYMITESIEEEENDYEKITSQLVTLKNHDFILACLNTMKKHHLLLEDTLILLSDREKCISMFEHYNIHGILFAVDPTQDINEQRKDFNGNTRYYAEIYEIDGKEYFVSSEWGTDDESARMPFINWVVSQLRKINYHTGIKSNYSRNRILFGAPGTGKSFVLNSEKETLLEDGGEYERVTFHPDYSYANFVGTYKPVPFKDNDGKDIITYAYVPGPFMRAYVKALQSSRTSEPSPVLLIIEEINRANVSAVFGDVFQLLDRGDNNVSEYPIITSEDIKKYLKMELRCEETDLEEIKIPDNMFIWATMNSADQGVFPMDTAFKRRWDFTYLGIDHSEENIKNKFVTLGKGRNARRVEWNELRKAINEELCSYRVNEDKLLGSYFLSKKIFLENGEIDQTKFIEAFVSKVIMYLFEDAARQKRSTLFAGCENADSNTLKYSSVCEEFKEKGVFIFSNKICAKLSDTAIPMLEEHEK